MLLEVQAGPYTVRGVSVGGVYTSLQVPELGVVLDAGVPLRSFAGTDRLFLSHGHADHAGALAALLGIRVLIGKGPAHVYFPAELQDALLSALAAQQQLHRCDLTIHPHPLLPGQEEALGHGLFVRAFRTHHHGPSLGYQFLRRVTKLRPEHLGLPPREVARLRREGHPHLFEETERLELAYATDTLSDVLESAPFLLDSRVLVLECTFVDAHRGVEVARERAHLHLDEVLARADAFRNEALVLMHFSQAYSPEDVHAVLQKRLPASLRERVVAFAPEGGRWFG